MPRPINTLLAASLVSISSFSAHILAQAPAAPPHAAPQVPFQIPVQAAPAPAAARSIVLSSGWLLQDASKVSASSDMVATRGFETKNWYPATVPGTVLTSLVNDGIYPDPIYGENNRPESIPETLCRTNWWYRTEVPIPAGFAGKHIWLNFDGINYSSEIWVNGKQIGTTRGAFIRGDFDITDNVKPGDKAVIAVLVSPQPHPGVSHEHTLRTGMGPNGGESAIDGPTFLSTIGWDWVPAIRDRDSGIWQKVTLSTTGPVLIKNPLVTTDLDLPDTTATNIVVEALLENITGDTQKGVFHGSIENINFQMAVEIPPHGTQKMQFNWKNTPALHMKNPRLWWPNGYGPQNLYKLHLSFIANNKPSDSQDVSFGVRKITYSVPDSENLTISVNGVRVFIRGGDWGLDEALKRIPRERLDAEIHMHQIANLNTIRNWVGQSTSEDFYDLADKYGLLIWDEFFQPNPSDGPDPTDLDTYMANVRDKILRYRNHPSIMLWCARNEGFPPDSIDRKLRDLLLELEPTRRYQPSSTSGAGVRSGGPYHWREPREFYKITDDYFKTETGSMSVPTLESIHGMLAQKDWEQIGDAWAEHDFARGAQQGDQYPLIIGERYGKVLNLADFVRKAQLMNFEAYRAMYEGREARLFHPATAVITWMSHPAQPSFTWQLYHYDLEPNSSLFAVRSAGEMQHIQLNEALSTLEVVNNLPTSLDGAVAHITLLNLDGTIASESDEKVSVTESSAVTIGMLQLPEKISNVHFLKLDLHSSAGKLLSTNFYWLQGPENNGDDFTDLSKLPAVTLDSQVARADAGGKTTVTVILHNDSKSVALMTHVQLRRKTSNKRVLPAFYDANYVSLIPGESRTIHIQADTRDLHGEPALITVDGWNVTVKETGGQAVSIAPNIEADPAHWPVTNLPFQSVALR